MKCKTLTILIAIILSTLCLSATAVNAQGTRISVSGNVTDSYGRNVERAKVIINHLPTGSLYASITDKSGDFSIPNLMIGGPYELTITHERFKPYTLSGLYFVLGKDMFFNVKLEEPERKKRKKSDSITPYVVILSIDGCRWDYPTMANMPNLAKMAKTGVKAEAIIPAYPTKTFPNHYTMATGLYPDHHGIVQNSFYDPDLKKRFTMGNRLMVQDSLFWEGEPIWVTAGRQGVRAASFFWVGTETDQYFKPSRRKYFDDQIPFTTRIDSVVSWLYLPQENRPQLLMFYFEEPDGTGHNFGPDAPETRSMLEHLDSLVGVVATRIRQAEKELSIKINFIVTSDHGMGYIPEGQTIYLTDYVRQEQLEAVAGGNPVWILQPAPGQNDSVFAALSNVPHLKAWHKDRLPAHYHYGTHKRIFDLVVEADAGWGVEIERRNRKHSPGTHGYDPQNPDMHAIFYATGPAFRRGYVQPAFENVNLYSLLAHLLKIEPAQTDGSLEPVRGMLRSYE